MWLCRYTIRTMQMQVCNVFLTLWLFKMHGSRPWLRANSNLGFLKLPAGTQGALSVKIIGCIMICAPARNTSLDLHTASMLCTLRTCLLLAGATLRRSPLATKFHFMLVRGDQTNSFQRIACRLFAARTLGCHRPAPALILAVVLFSFDIAMLRFLETCGRPSCPPYASNAQEILSLSAELCPPGQPSLMSWTMSARVVSSKDRTQFSFVNSGMVIRSTMSMTPSVFLPAPPPKGKRSPAYLAPLWMSTQ